MATFSRTTLGAVILSLALGGGSVRAQNAPGPILPVAPGPGPSGRGPVLPAGTGAPLALVPLQLIVTIARYDGDERVSNQPFTLWVNANENQATELSTGQQVPIPQQVSSAIPGAPMRSFTYQNIGTTLQAKARSMDGGRFRVDLQVSDTSVEPAKDTDGMVSLKSFKSTNVLLLSDRQTAEFVAASDKINGQVTRITVTATVLP